MTLDLTDYNYVLIDSIDSQVDAIINGTMLSTGVSHSRVDVSTYGSNTVFAIHTRYDGKLYNVWLEK